MPNLAADPERRLLALGAVVVAQVADGHEGDIARAQEPVVLGEREHVIAADAAAVPRAAFAAHLGVVDHPAVVIDERAVEVVVGQRFARAQPVVIGLALPEAIDAQVPHRLGFAPAHEAFAAGRVGGEPRGRGPCPALSVAST